MAKGRGGTVCSAKDCPNKTYTCNKSFFRFPPDVTRAKMWAIACNREDLLDRLENHTNGYRLCADHFDNKMFTNEICNRLKPNALPTIFPCVEGFARQTDNIYSRPALLHSSGTFSQEGGFTRQNDHVHSQPVILHPRETFPYENLPQTQILRAALVTPGKNFSSELYVDTELIMSPSPEPCSSVMSTQTSASLSINSPRKVKYRCTIKQLRNENKKLKRKIEKLKESLPNKKRIMLDQCPKHSFKFSVPKENMLNRCSKHFFKLSGSKKNIMLDECPKHSFKISGSVKLANFMNQAGKKPEGRRYSV